MSRELHGGGRWPGLWKVSPARRVSTPAAEVVAARPLQAALHAALGDDPAPCASHPEVWTSDQPDDVLVAAEGCHGCPARQPCGAYADAIEASAGTWGGVDRTPRDARRRPTSTDSRRTA